VYVGPRATLKTTENKLTADHSLAKAQYEAAENGLKRHLDLPALTPDDALATVNKRRKLLGLSLLPAITKDTDLSRNSGKHGFGIWITAPNSSALPACGRMRDGRNTRGSLLLPSKATNQSQTESKLRRKCQAFREAGVRIFADAVVSKRQALGRQSPTIPSAKARPPCRHHSGGWRLHGQVEGNGGPGSAINVPPPHSALTIGVCLQWRNGRWGEIRAARTE